MKWGREGFFLTNPDVTDILGDMDLDFDNFYYSHLLVKGLVKNILNPTLDQEELRILLHLKQRRQYLIMLDLVLYSLQVVLLRLSQVILQKILHSLLLVELQENPLLQQQKLDLVHSQRLVDMVDNHLLHL